MSNFDIAQRRIVVASGTATRLIKTDKNNFGRASASPNAFGAEKRWWCARLRLLYTLDGVDNRR